MVLPISYLVQVYSNDNRVEMSKRFATEAAAKSFAEQCVSVGMQCGLNDVAHVFNLWCLSQSSGEHTRFYPILFVEVIKV